MAILVVGSVAFDSIETPHGKVDHCLGGAATHFALAASFFTDVRVIAVVGEDFLPKHEAVFTARGIDTAGIERAPGLSFHWTGAYTGTLSEAQTLLFQAPLLAVFPGVAIAVAVLGLNLLGDGLRDLLDPRLARKR